MAKWQKSGAFMENKKAREKIEFEKFVKRVKFYYSLPK
jgi:hypothetical protein